MNKFGFVIPVYRHGSTLENVVKQLLHYNYPLIVIDDGNDEENRKLINAVAEKYESVSLVTRQKNGGKGRAMTDGIIRAHELGLTHILQVDSDGQHDIGRTDFFLSESEKHPEALICGYPEYDESVPKHRLNGRRIANAWIHIVTLSTEIKDALIGFRVYPVEPYYRMIRRHTIIDTHMGYDTDILVHYSWKGVQIISQPVKIRYPEDGISTFRMVRDNLHISLTFARLCIGMILRLPVLLGRKIRRSL